MSTSSRRLTFTLAAPRGVRSFANAPVPIWLHFNGLDYNGELDQIVVSIRQFSEIWVISHDPMESGGLLYRWGNPEAYGRGGPADQVFDGQHNPRWIREGLR